MPRDSRLYMTIYTDDTELRPYHRSFRPECFAYLVAWRSAGIVKVGETWSPRRWRHFLSTGAEIMLIARTDGMTALDIERVMYEHFTRTTRLAFASREESEPYLRRAGGHMECFMADADEALAKMREVIGALVQG